MKNAFICRNIGLQSLYQNARDFPKCTRFHGSVNGSELCDACELSHLAMDQITTSTPGGLRVVTSPLGTLYDFVWELHK